MILYIHDKNVKFILTWFPGKAASVEECVYDDNVRDVRGTFQLTNMFAEDSTTVGLGCHPGPHDCYCQRY